MKTVHDLKAALFTPVTCENWEDLVELFGVRGACGGCWCMYWRLTHREFQEKKGVGNKKLFHKLVSERKPVGVMAEVNGKPVGWCSISPRKDLIRLSNSRLLKPVDEQPVWSITCLFINKEFRRLGLSKDLIKAACDYAKGLGAQIIEAYPIIPKKDPVPDVFAWVGFVESFRKAGFKRVEERSETRLLMRYHIY